MEQSVRERIKPEELLKLASEVADVDVLKRSWDFVTTKVAASQIENLDELAQRLTHEQGRLGRIDADLNSVASALHWNDGFAPTIDEARNIVEALPKLLVARSYNGNWVDASTRGRIKQQIEAVLLDLSELKNCEKTYESRFSHRAFLPTAASDC